MQKLIIAGACGRDAELRSLASGDPVLNFSIAVDNGRDRDGNRLDSTWYDAAIFGKRAESLAPHIKKGDKLTLIGRPSVRVHEGKAYLGITVDDLAFMGRAQGSGEPRPARDSAEDYAAKRAPAGGGYPDTLDDDDDIPFEMSWK
jgi:single-strand DNA-binding protein